MGTQFWSSGAVVKLLSLSKNYFSVAPLQKYLISQGKVFCCSGECCTPGAIVVAMAVC